jgi:succinoglycan biosynthesis protein ExoL
MHGSLEALNRVDLPTAQSDAEANVTRQLVFFCPDVGETSTITRANQFIDDGYSVTAFGFRRGRYNRSYQPSWPFVTLGQTLDGRYRQRLRALLAALPVIFANRRILRAARVFYARNMDQLLLAILARLMVGSRSPLIYEVLDIPAILMRRGLVAAILRLVERLCLKLTKVLVLSSPGFHRGYYAPVQNYRGPWFLLENKLHPSIVRLSPRPSAPIPVSASNFDRPWVVGYFGLIRGEQTFDLITRLADRLQGRVVFKFRGVLTTVERSRFEAALRGRSNIVYGGPYLPYRDLEQLYRDVDFAWAIDLEHADHNSRWLLPCRFYEAGYFGVPCLAVRGFEIGSLLERHHIGWTFDAPLEETLVRFFKTLRTEDYRRIRGRVRAMPADAFVAGGEAARLSRMIGVPGR